MTSAEPSEAGKLTKLFSTESEFEVWQDGMPVAEVGGADREAVLRDALHYVAMYAQDGPAILVEVRRRVLTPLVSDPIEADGSASHLREGEAERVAGSEAQRSTGNTPNPPTLTPGEQS